MTGEAQRWLDSARRSLDAAEILYAAGRWPQTCFNAQQAAELALKAALAQESAPPRVHSIAELLARQNRTVSQALGPTADSLRSLDRYYTSTRYPDAVVGELPAESDANRALEAARDVVPRVARLLALVAEGDADDRRASQSTDQAET